jgi:hypothetical protein
MSNRNHYHCRDCGQPSGTRRVCAACAPTRAGQHHRDRYLPADPDPAPVLDVAALRARFNAPRGEP